MAKQNSPYFLTPVNNYYLDILVKPEIAESADDKYYVIEKKYEYRPDKLAKDLYGDESFWYVFMLRNMDKIKNPIYDFQAGIEIRLPSQNAIRDLT